MKILNFFGVLCVEIFAVAGSDTCEYGHDLSNLKKINLIVLFHNIKHFLLKS